MKMDTNTYNLFYFNVVSNTTTHWDDCYNIYSHLWSYLDGFLRIENILTDCRRCSNIWFYLCMSASRQHA